MIFNCMYLKSIYVLIVSFENVDYHETLLFARYFECLAIITIPISYINRSINLHNL